ncbi:unnamed protein product [Bemisia tabaci]|uniref:Immunoglobulin I-set domain-containing protein n=1 Tax=Bemisia tabaci TaxID=7038 RepID=A0A9N9ZYV4_BEMTA|nr:unnamed protein product [Bemisia tabaci]
MSKEIDKPSVHEAVISYNSVRGGISVITEKGEVTTSYLLIQNADLSDTGNYSCCPSNADGASVKVHVLNGKLSSLHGSSHGDRYENDLYAQVPYSMSQNHIQTNKKFDAGLRIEIESVLMWTNITTKSIDPVSIP